MCAKTGKRDQARANLPLYQLLFVRGIHRWPVNSPHIGPVLGETFPYNDVILCTALAPLQLISVQDDKIVQ